MEGCRTAAERGLGVTYLSRFAAEEPIRAGQLRRLVVPKLQHHRTLYISLPVGATLSGPACFLVDLVREHLADAATPREPAAHLASCSCSRSSRSAASGSSPRPEYERRFDPPL